MKNFDNINFKGTFRDYQKIVIENLDKYFDDEKINIVAAPGSGKTILGLELIRKLGSNCLVFSPTTTIRNQWGDRFEEMFLPKDEKAEDYVSFDLNKIRPITSVTYQALYSAMKKIKIKTEDETVDYSYIEIFKLIEENNIKTICLDEAHHLQNEWQKALESFVKGLSSKVKIISLTATPPYDAGPAEWKRYSETCGEIDEEIFVPELVARNNLCPHQDYIYFNFPTTKELNELEVYKQNSQNALEEIKNLPYISLLPKKINELFKNNKDTFYENINEYIALFSLLKHFETAPSNKVIKALTSNKDLPAFNLTIAETALNYLVKAILLLTQEEREEIFEIAKKFQLVNKGKIELELNDNLKKNLISSMGKLESIKQIVKCELASINSNLRLLILTDFIKKEGLKKIGTDCKFNNISVISIFESLRRENFNAKLGVVSGSIVILPEDVAKSIKKDKKNKIKIQKIGNTDYCFVEFSGSNREKVDKVGELFEDGKIQILIGTKSLLGEGWDSPCINSLILASFVGSFMLSNQMRGRAIRINKSDPNKTANIWHLVTIEPPELTEINVSKKEDLKINEPTSYDYETLKRRFNSFVGPDYITNQIVSGIDRIKIIKPPYNAEGINAINAKMEEMSSKREKLSEIWKTKVTLSSKTSTVIEIPKQKKPPNLPACILMFLLSAIFLSLIVSTICFLAKLKTSFDIFNLIIAFASFAVACCIIKPLAKILPRGILNLSPRLSIKAVCKCVLNSLKELRLVEEITKVMIEKQDKNKFIVALKNASAYEQNIFTKALSEFFEEINEPRYLIVKSGYKKYLNYRLSFACPTIISKKEAYVINFANYLSKYFGKMQTIYTKNIDGTKELITCRKRSYLSTCNEKINKRIKVL